MPLRKHEERQARMRFLCKVSSSLKLATFLQTTALQRLVGLSGVRSWLVGSVGVGAFPSMPRAPLRGHEKNDSPWGADCKAAGGGWRRGKGGEEEGEAGGARGLGRGKRR